MKYAIIVVKESSLVSAFAAGELFGQLGVLLVFALQSSQWSWREHIPSFLPFALQRSMQFNQMVHSSQFSAVQPTRSSRPTLASPSIFYSAC
mgnify:CR=1 FL=1